MSKTLYKDKHFQPLFEVYVMFQMLCDKVFDTRKSTNSHATPPYIFNHFTKWDGQQKSCQ